MAMVLLGATTALARPGGGGGETPCYIPGPQVSSCTFWKDTTDPTECPDQTYGGGLVPSTTEGSPGLDGQSPSGSGDCFVVIWKAHAGSDPVYCDMVTSGWASISGWAPSGDGC